MRVHLHFDPLLAFSRGRETLGLVGVLQAGLTLGISLIIERTFPSIGSGFRSLAVTAVAVNEIVGPNLFQLALDRTGESSQERQSLTAQLAPK